MEIHAGCSGWFYWHWKGIFYPAEERTDRWFRHYTQVFDTVELNAPFYRWPTPANVKAWARNAPENFRYSVKVNGEITHEKRMRRTRKRIQEFYFIADILGPKLGCFLFQFPPSYRYTPSRLKSIVDQIDPVHRNAIEFRHRSWWREAVFRRFRERGLSFCSVSGPRLPGPLVKTSDVIYVRFHGLSRWYRHDYTSEELSEWTRKIVESGAREAWLYFNNDREGHAIRNAQELRRQLEFATKAAE